MSRGPEREISAVELRRSPGFALLGRGVLTLVVSYFPTCCPEEMCQCRSCTVKPGGNTPDMSF